MNDAVSTTKCWNRDLDEWTAWLRAGDRARSTIKLRRYHVEQFAATVAPLLPGDVTEGQVAAYLSTDRWSPSTRRSHRSSISQFYRWATTHGRSTHDPTVQLLPITPTHTVPRPAPDHVILEAIHASPPRVRLMLLLGSEAGLRRAEIAGIRRDHITERDHASLHVDGKGRRQRVIPLSDRLRAELSLYDDEGPWLFPSPYRAGPIGPIRVGELVSAALPTPWACHSLRHRFATVTYTNSHDLLLVQRLMGHTKPETTAGYIQLDLTDAHGVIRSSSLTA